MITKLFLSLTGLYIILILQTQDLLSFNNIQINLFLVFMVYIAFISSFYAKGLWILSLVCLGVIVYAVLFFPFWILQFLFVITISIFVFLFRFIRTGHRILDFIIMIFISHILFFVGMALYRWKFFSVDVFFVTLLIHTLLGAVMFYRPKKYEFRF